MSVYEDTGLLRLLQGLGGVTGGAGALGIRDQEHQVGVGELLGQVHPVEDECTKHIIAFYYIALHQKHLPKVPYKCVLCS